jgi:DNA-binding NtrC family response regulator
LFLPNIPAPTLRKYLKFKRKMEPCASSRFTVIMEPAQQSILVVEDEAFIRMSTVASLEDAGLCVLEAANSAQALVLLERHAEICVMVTDVRMPGAIDGLALVSLVQRDHPVIRSVVVSGNATATQAFKAGAAKFIAKPYLMHKVVGAVLGLIPRNGAPLGVAA